VSGTQLAAEETRSPAGRRLHFLLPQAPAESLSPTFEFTPV
jgi:hypothetical protein